MTQYLHFSTTFEALPIDHIVGQSEFVVHSGLFRNDCIDIPYVQRINRFCQPSPNTAWWDIL
jgi:hypothetical protein